MRVLQISAHFHPNIGGVETHLTDLIQFLKEKNWQVTVLSYQPLTANKRGKVYERHNRIEIIRVPWIPNFFYKLISYPAIEFIYLVPGLFVTCPFLIFSKKPDVIHAHGLVAGFAGIFWGKIFGKRVIISSHSIYHFPKKGLYKTFAKWIFTHADKILALSKKSVTELQALGVPKKGIVQFTYWVNLKNFRKVIKDKKISDSKYKFTVLFVGRLIKEKGVIELLESFKTWDRKNKLIIAGKGPLEGFVKQCAKKFNNLEAVGAIDQDKLPFYYSSADITVVPSTSEEGFGRIIIESLACGTPVIGSCFGAIPESMDNTVGKIIKVTPKNIKDTVNYFIKNKSELNKLSLNCRRFAERRYSEQNAESIIKTYTD